MVDRSLRRAVRMVVAYANDMRMTGKHLKGIRDALGLEPFAWADVIGVHVTTIYRWETSEVVKMDPLQRRIVDALHHRLPTLPAAARKELGARVRNALVGGGPLVGLYELLSFVTSKEKT